MSKFKVRILVPNEYVVEAATGEEVANAVRAGAPTAVLLGIIPADQEWPDRAETPLARPPRNTPPSGSPGTPTPAKDPVFVQAVAA